MCHVFVICEEVGGWSIIRILPYMRMLLIRLIFDLVIGGGVIYHPLWEEVSY